MINKCKDRECFVHDGETCRRGSMKIEYCDAYNARKEIELLMRALAVLPYVTLNVITDVMNEQVRNTIMDISHYLATPVPSPFAYLRGDEEDGYEFASSEDGFPVFVSPQDIKPLTESNIEAILSSISPEDYAREYALSDGSPGGIDFSGYDFAIARAIEKAHGIV